MNRRFSLLALLLVAAILAACAGEAPTAASTQEPEDTEAPTEAAMEELSGDVVIDGSSTVYPITTAVAEEFSAVYPDVRVSVGLSGTGGGFEKFCAGETDISDASRPIKDEEAAICADNGIEFAEMLVALDGLTVVVNPENDFIDCLNTAQLVQLFGVNGTATTWADLDPSWPAEEIRFFVPDPDSGTRDYMIEVLEKADEAATDLRQDDNTTNSSDDNVLLTGVENDANAVGFFGYAYYVEAQDQVRAVAIENKDGECVEPSNETVQGGSYNPLSRPLFIYPNLASVTDKPQVAAFVRYFMEEGAEAIMGDVGYSLPPEGTFEDNLVALDAIMAGTYTMGEADEPAPTAEPTEEMVALEGDVVIDGSSTVYPITTAVAEEFSAVYPDVRVSVGLSGTGGGFEKFCAGETDISDASRPIKDEEAQICADNGIEFTEMLVALDGLTVVVNPENDFVTCLTTAQLVQLFGVNGTATTWADIDPSWPAEEIKYFVPDPDSGTRDYMIEVLVKADKAATDLRQDDNTTNSSDDNVLLTGVENDANAVGFFGYAYYVEAQDQVRAVAIENKDGECVEPSNETVQGGSYNPLSRPLFIYPNNASLLDKPQVAAFVAYFMNEGAELVMGDVGYSLPPEGTFEANLGLLAELLGQ